MDMIIPHKIFSLQFSENWPNNERENYMVQDAAAFPNFSNLRSYLNLSSPFPPFAEYIITDCK
jgi:hypothetical protein